MVRLVRLPKKRLFPTENAFRVYASLGDLLEKKDDTDKGVLIAEIAAKSKISYGAAYYWIKVFVGFGFVTKNREQRQASNTVKRFQIVVKWNPKKDIADLERLVNCDQWLLEFHQRCNPPLPRKWPLPKK